MQLKGWHAAHGVSAGPSIHSDRFRWVPGRAGYKAGWKGHEAQAAMGCGRKHRRGDLVAVNRTAAAMGRGRAAFAVMPVLTFVAAMRAVRPACVLQGGDASGRIGLKRMGLRIGQAGDTQGKQDCANRQPAQDETAPAARIRLAFLPYRQHAVPTVAQTRILFLAIRPAMMQINRAELLAHLQMILPATVGSRATHEKISNAITGGLSSRLCWVSHRILRLDGRVPPAYSRAMRFTGTLSTWRSFFAAILVVMLTLAPVVQAQAAASHADHAMAQMPMMEAYAQHDDCCAETGGGEHAGHAACGTCVLPCMNVLHALTDTPLEASPFGVSSHHGLGGQLAAGLSTVPDPRPPKTRS